MFATDETKKMDLDRPLSYFKLEEPIVLKVTPSSEKSYSAMFVSEGDRDVMVLSYVDSKYDFSMEIAQFATWFFFQLIPLFASISFFLDWK